MKSLIIQLMMRRIVHYMQSMLSLQRGSRRLFSVEDLENISIMIWIKLLKVL